MFSTHFWLFGLGIASAPKSLVKSSRYRAWPGARQAARLAWFGGRLAGRGGCPTQQKIRWRKSDCVFVLVEGGNFLVTYIYFGAQQSFCVGPIRISIRKANPTNNQLSNGAPAGEPTARVDKNLWFPVGAPAPQTPHIEFSYLKIRIFHYKRFSKGQDKTGDSGQGTEQRTGQDRTREQDKTRPDSGEDGGQDRGQDMGT